MRKFFRKVFFVYVGLASLALIATVVAEILGSMLLMIFGMPILFVLTTPWYRVIHGLLVHPGVWGIWFSLVGGILINAMLLYPFGFSKKGLAIRNFFRTLFFLFLFLDGVAAIFSLSDLWFVGILRQTLIVLGMPWTFVRKLGPMEHWRLPLLIGPLINAMIFYWLGWRCAWRTEEPSTDD